MESVRINIISKVVSASLIGCIIGEIIAYFNIFGSSQKAPLFCAMGAGIYMVFKIRSNNT